MAEEEVSRKEEEGSRKKEEVRRKELTLEADFTLGPDQVNTSCSLSIYLCSFQFLSGCK